MDSRLYDDDLTPDDPNEDQSTRLWLSDRQWMALLERARRAKAEPLTVESSPGDRRGENRLPTSCRCVLRWGGKAAGTYAVRAVNISSGGLGFVHRHPLDTGTRCTLALQVEGHNGMILAGRVAWCKPLTSDHSEDTHEVGLQFDQPIDLEPFGHVA